MEKKNELPMEVVEEIMAEAKKAAVGFIQKAPKRNMSRLDLQNICQISYGAGATAYTAKLQQANETIKALTYDNNRLKGQVEGLTNAVEELKKGNQKLSLASSSILKTNDRLVSENGAAKDLLDEVFRKHESGLLPDRFIYEKIKTFLYGE